MAGWEWQQAEFDFMEGRMRLIVRKTDGVFFGIVYLAIPAAMADGYAEAFSVFLESLALDPPKWLASLKKGK